MTFPRSVPDIPRPRTGECPGRSAPHRPIDVGDLRSGLAGLHSPDPSVRDATAAAVRASPERYPPPVLYALADDYYRRGQREDAVFWYHAGQLRARFDVERCADPTVVDVLAQLRRQYGARINRFAFVEAELSVLRTAVHRAVEWDRRTPSGYDHRWVNLHGVRAYPEPGQGVALSRPADQWAAIAARVRARYLDEMDALLADLESWSPVSTSA